MPNVSFVHPELKRKRFIYSLVSDCVEGDHKIKERKTKYLPMPDATNLSNDNIQRYKDYLKRAIFYNVTKATYAGLIGQIFAKDPEINLPTTVAMLEKNADGTGNSLSQLSKDGIGKLLEGGRFGLLSDYPTTIEDLTQSQIDEGSIRPFIKIYKSSDILNWRTKIVGSETFKEQWQFRVLWLNKSGDYQVDIYRNGIQVVETDSETITPIANGSFGNPWLTVIPKDFNGHTIKRIPFEFAGCDNNDAKPDMPILYDIAVLNIGHYHNSADYEESVYMVGQPTPVFVGLSEEWAEKHTIGLGSRGAIPLPLNGSASLLQAAPNTMPMEAMLHKESQFLALGAKLVTPSAGGQAKTATESNISNVTETSILSSLTNNASEAFEAAIEHCLQFVQSELSDVTFKLNTNFAISAMTDANRAQLLNEWLKGGISKTEYRNNLRAGKVQLLDDQASQDEIDQETLDSFAIDAKNPANKQPVVSSVGK